ncbi:hypothetical protein CBS115989_5761 [Aspergillus niger]|nr:uncharacterized protein BO96DRAFT_18033 [Aspergillus niger CBS 101883]KAI2817686.1 hypothetical protein CBS115989_5761 [Aspergillus niger]RDH16645.1 hypothetical protein M747DRAFT_373409 [Aspergillus niger ATCC 13496]KAI2853948.1 hypothetical protein CBS11232_5260 [Aspergillus niger]KAI2874846.1 hypothetical protein CBS115988_5864 [Aspergillus niger]KAI2898313.1 hypothetical protein CBS11852_3687 [Aspergillus niger]|eukprot:XP_001391413.2 hypothetical protein ANI_1_1650064 [Aspergillus niger CBS 513.88]
MTNSILNSSLMQRPRKMKCLSSIFLPCLQARKLRRQRRQDYHASWTCAGISELAQPTEPFPAYEHEKHHHGSTELSALPDQPKDAVTKTPQMTPSIRLVNPADSECSTLDDPDEKQPQGIQDDIAAKQTTTLSDDDTDVESGSEKTSRVIDMKVGPQTEEPLNPKAHLSPKSKDDIDLELSSRRIPRSPDKKPRPASMEVPPSAAAKLPEIKSRIIEDIPEDVEEEDKHDADIKHTVSAVPDEQAKPEEEYGSETAATKPTKRTSTWRLSQRKSMNELFNLLQSTAAAVAAAPKLSNLKFAIPPKSPLRASPTNDSPHHSYVSSVSSTSNRPPTPPPKSPVLRPNSRPLPDPAQLSSSAPPASGTSLGSLSSSPTKKQRRMGTAVFPLLPCKWAGIHDEDMKEKHSNDTNRNSQTLFQ